MKLTSILTDVSAREPSSAISSHNWEISSWNNIYKHITDNWGGLEVGGVKRMKYWNCWVSHVPCTVWAMVSTCCSESARSPSSLSLSCSLCWWLLWPFFSNRRSPGEVAIVAFTVSWVSVSQKISLEGLYGRVSLQGLSWGTIYNRRSGRAGGSQYYVGDHHGMIHVVLVQHWMLLP